MKNVGLGKRSRKSLWGGIVPRVFSNLLLLLVSASCVVATPPTITTTSPLPNGVINRTYSATLTATGGTAPLNWSIVSGSLPPGFNSLNSSTGAITGTPTTAGTFNFTVQVSDSGTPVLSTTKPLSITVTNPIVDENLKPGNSPDEWDIDGAGDTTIQGFATDISVNKGDTIHFKVKTNATNYRLDIYRLGYYGGSGARLVARKSPGFLPQTQPNPITDASTGLVDCGNWAESASWLVPATARSGVHIARLVRTEPRGKPHSLCGPR